MVEREMENHLTQRNMDLPPPEPLNLSIAMKKLKEFGCVMQAQYISFEQTTCHAQVSKIIQMVLSMIK